MGGRNPAPHHFETVAETVVCWHLQGNRIIPGFLRWCRISSTHSSPLGLVEFGSQREQCDSLCLSWGSTTLKARFHVSHGLGFTMTHSPPRITGMGRIEPASHHPLCPHLCPQFRRNKTKIFKDEGRRMVRHKSPAPSPRSPPRRSAGAAAASWPSASQHEGATRRNKNPRPGPGNFCTAVVQTSQTNRAYPEMKGPQRG